MALTYRNNAPATPKQLFYLFTMTGLHTKNLAITNNKAGNLIDAFLKGDCDFVVRELQSLGATGEVKIKKTESQWEELYQKAHDAGMAAVAVMAPPVPMVVCDGAYAYAPVMDGVCGFAWVTVRPGNCAFANWLKKTDRGRKDTYGGGVAIWVSLFNQSMAKKEVYAAAFAQVLAAEGIKATMGSRMD